MEDINANKIEVKNKIQQLINEGRMGQAEKLISQYEEIIKDDIEIISMKAVMLIMSNKLEEAENILHRGLSLDKNNPNILFNLAYVYEINEKYDEAYKYYLRTKNNSEDSEFISNVDSIINNLKESFNLNLEDKKRNIKTSIIILTYNKLDYTKLCIDSIRKYTKTGTYEIIIVDNNSTDDTRLWLKEQKDIKVILNNENLGFPGGCNVGIKAAEKENDILLLNNDTILTPRWLENLNNCLYSDEHIGAVGAVTNNCANHQAIAIEYQSIDEMIAFADKYNVSDSSKWEQKVRLIGYCMLIKRSVMDKVGLLDEMFFPGNFEDDDLGYRIQSEGYKLILCNDTFIHHFGSTSFKENVEKFNSLLRENSKKFINKWSFDSEENCLVNFNIMQKLDVNKADFNVLHIGCGTGSLLHKIKYVFKDANLYGMDNDKATAKILNNFANVKVASIDDELDYSENFFDYIIVTNSVEYSKAPRIAVQRLLKFIKETGKIIVTIKNSNFYGELIKILMGSADFSNKKLYNYNEIKEIFSCEDFSDTIVESETVNLSSDNEIVLNHICKLTGENMKSQYITKEYLITSGKNFIDKKEIPYILKRTENINKKLKSYDVQELRFLLRRIENDVEKEESENRVIELIRENLIDCDKIIDVVDRDMIKKEEILNTVAVKCYESNVYESIIPLLQKAYEINNDSKNTVYNLAYMLHIIGENKLALEYLEQLTIKDNDIITLINEIQGE